MMMPCKELPERSAMLSACDERLDMAAKDQLMASVHGQLTLYPLQYLSQSGFNFTLMSWGPSIVIQDSVFH